MGFAVPGLSKGSLLPAPAVAAASNGMVMNAAGLWVRPPGFPISDLGRAYTGDGATTPETSLLAAGAALASLFPAMAVGDAFDIELGFTLLNNSGTNTYTSTIKVYHGAYVLTSKASAALTSSATIREASIRLKGIVEVAGAANAAKLRLKVERWGLDTVQAVGVGARVVASGTKEEDAGATTGTDANLVTNAARDFNVTATHSNNTASMTTTLTFCQVRLYPLNY